jgi:hypothetical protein
MDRFVDLAPRFHPGVFAAADPFAVNERVEPYPTHSDSNLLEYYLRVKSVLGGSDFFLSSHHLQAQSAPLWESVREFLRVLMRAGLRLGLTICQSFLGKFKSWPNGVHRDAFHFFTFMWRGSMRFRLWPARCAEEKHPRFFLGQRDYGEFLDGAMTFDLEEGDLLYWPSGHWYVVESDDVAATIFLACSKFGSGLQPVRSVHEALVDRIANRSQPVSRVVTSGMDLAEIPHLVEETVTHLLAQQEGTDFVDDVWRFWLEFASQLSLGEPPEFPISTSAPSERLVVNPREKLDWLRLNDGRLLCAVNGGKFEVDFSPEIVGILERIVAPEPWTLEELTRSLANSSLHDTVHRLVDELFRLRAVIGARTGAA